MSQIQSLIEREHTFEEEIQALKQEYQRKRERLQAEYEERLENLRTKLQEKDSIIAEEVDRRLEDTKTLENPQMLSVSEERVHALLRNEITKE